METRRLAFRTFNIGMPILGNGFYDIPALHDICTYAPKKGWKMRTYDFFVVLCRIGVTNMTPAGQVSGYHCASPEQGKAYTQPLGVNRAQIFTVYIISPRCGIARTEFTVFSIIRTNLHPLKSRWVSTPFPYLSQPCSLRKIDQEMGIQERLLFAVFLR
ncbi:hypothetical protein BC936DRAFT_145529 [Jimgerdemannia flammicorona]|uniref:Uncharacterized protein n=2 Tax=Jimgerdemannia flammicorona TaxID=994334 RepID=A0A433QSC1_9FUNG|nr:hypothetical protein BC936DRAFT_145529 [Jimgerdemannia flammicorona]RUS32661.1 hypothetical protein BC938DRAFT_474683 [Jimgerdemannia flammicorona]